jgi:hypothetical protein
MSLGKSSAISNGRNHRTCDERTDARNCHQLPTTLALMCQHFDLLGNVLDALIEMPASITCLVISGCQVACYECLKATFFEIVQLSYSVQAKRSFI